MLLPSGNAKVSSRDRAYIFLDPAAITIIVELGCQRQWMSEFELATTRIEFKFRVVQIWQTDVLKSSLAPNRRLRN
jgi:hypothetical protein